MSVYDERLPIAVNGEALLCPTCGGEYLHQSGVRMHTRAAEDGAGQEVEVSAAGVAVRLLDEKNSRFEGRRSDLAIDFWCEGCSPAIRVTHRLFVIQHKGITHVGWKIAGPVAVVD